jgi:hypothetical protein
LGIVRGGGLGVGLVWVGITSASYRRRNVTLLIAPIHK